MVDGLVDEGTLAIEAMPPPLAPPAPDPQHAQPEFSRQQRTAVDAIRALAASGSFADSRLVPIHGRVGVGLNRFLNDAEDEWLGGHGAE